EFYKIILNDLDLPYLKGPGLLRITSSRIWENKHKFSYHNLVYRTSEDLDVLFSNYIEKLKLPIVEYIEFQSIDNFLENEDYPRFQKTNESLLHEEIIQFRRSDEYDADYY